MKINLKSTIIFILASMYSVNALADKTKHSIGIDVFKSDFSFQEHYGNGVFKDIPRGINVFGQYDLPHQFFVEYGYEYMKAKNNTWLNHKDYYPGDLDGEPNRLEHYNSKIKQQFPYVGLGLKYKSEKSPNTYISFLGGVSIVKISGWFEILGDALNPTYDANQISQSRRTFSKTRPSFLFKVAVNHKFSNNFGMRLIGGWHRLKQFKIKSDTPSDLETGIRLRNCTSFGIGFFYSF